ncbi:hypothetical protein BV25DRAFT_1838991 [Artomyces pyxidatus]|uniref:Uncharacterized protein n=1 Tax=Artomyces pyxidatus TaxID=48021 RepID=A0ACB8SZH9_9AGAM|nr:hypothetical protein BV25DRAFT_1838991 [Artomyces pyxidatus]
MAISLTLLPEDILLEVLELSEGRDILACQATCRRLNTLIRDSIYLQYAKELFASGMLDGARGAHTVPIRERLDRLRCYTAAWEQLSWQSRMPLPHLVGCRGPLEVSGDAAQELLVFREYTDIQPPRIHLRSMLTSEVHPLANALPWQMRLEFNAQMYATYAVICETTTKPVSWNWKTGRVKAEGLAGTLGQLIFLDEHHVLTPDVLSRRSENVVRKRDSTHPACLHVIPLSPISLAPTASRAYMFALPDFLQQDVILGYVDACTLQTVPAPHGCFYPDPSDRLISIKLFVDHMEWYFLLDIHAQTLLRYIAAHPTTPGTTVVIVPWEVWGPHNTRITTSQNLIESTLCGSRRAITHQVSDSDRTAMLTVLDYSPHRVARAALRGTATILHGSELGTEYTGAEFGPLRTLLPCIATESPATGWPNEVGLGKAYICDDVTMLVLTFCNRAIYDSDRSSILVYTARSDTGLAGAAQPYTLVLPGFTQEHNPVEFHMVSMAPRPAALHSTDQNTRAIATAPLHTLRSYVATHPGSVVSRDAWGPRGTRDASTHAK